MKRSVAAILLAAGKSRRMGSCKQLLPLGRRPAIVCCLEALIQGGASEIVVVVGAGGKEVATVIQDYPVRIVVNHEAAGDMASSLRVGREAICSVAGGVIVALGDYPLVKAMTISSLIAAHREDPHAIVIPCYRRERGHPLLFPRTVLDELTGELVLRDLVRLDPFRVRSLAVDDPGILLDMDTPEDYRRLCALQEIEKEATPPLKERL